MIFYAQKRHNGGWLDIANRESYEEAAKCLKGHKAGRVVSSSERSADALLTSVRGLTDATAARDKDEFRAQIDIAKLVMRDMEGGLVSFDENGLTPGQSACLVDVQAGHNVLVTGAAGTGKSFLLKTLKEKLGGRLRVVATTGVAALNVKGATLHSWAGLGMGAGSAAELEAKVRENQTAVGNIQRAKILAVDEISMMGADLFDQLDELFRRIRESSEPFGGVQMVFFGDFLQLPPVSKSSEGGEFAFQSSSWDEANIIVHQLTTVVRQQESIFVEALARVRVGQVDPFVRRTLFQRVGATDPTPHIEPVVLECRNVDVDSYNIERLAALPGDEVVFEATERGTPSQLQSLAKNCLAPATLALKVGAQVMLLKNLDVEEGLVNGSLGVVLAIGDDDVTVNFGEACPSKTIVSSRWSIYAAGDDGNEEVAFREQIPLRLSYAITIHKSQGCTLSKARINLRTAFACGQAYVALSRVRDLAGLFIEEIRWESIRASPEAVEFYRSHTRDEPVAA